MLLKQTKTPRYFFLMVILLLSITLTACSTRWVYNQLDWLVPWYLSDYVDIEDYQEPEFDAALDRLLTWHRATQLPLYVEQLQAIKRQVNKELTTAEFNVYYATFNELISVTFTQLGKEFVPLLTQLSDEQKMALLANLAAKNQEFVEDKIEVGETASREETETKMREFMEDMLGGLTQPQIAFIKNWAKEKPWMTPSLYQNRLKWQQNLSRLLEQKPNNEMALLNLFKQRDQHWSPQFKQQMQQSREAIGKLIIAILNSSNANQRIHLLSKISHYIADINHLINKPT